MAITVISIDDARETIEAKRTREGKHVKWFAEYLDFIGELDTTETIPVDMLAQEFDGSPLGTSAASLAASYGAKVKKAMETDPELKGKLRVLKRKPANGEGLTVDNDGFSCLLVYN